MTLALVACAAVFAWFSFKYAWWRPATDYHFPRVLMYHMISEPCRGARFNGLRVSPAQFERQLRWLNAHGWHSVTVSELVQAGSDLPPKSYAITFDDGYADNYLQALPLLQRYNCKATLYLVVDRENRDWSVQRKAHHSGGELMREPKLTDKQVQFMLDSGRIELGSHGLTHANFDRLTNSEVARELQQSRDLLSQQFDVPVTSFAYPFGIFRPEHVPLVEKAGYQSAVTTVEGVESPETRNRFQLRRIKISGKDNALAFSLLMRTGYRGWH